MNILPESFAERSAFAHGQGSPELKFHGLRDKPTFAQGPRNGLSQEKRIRIHPTSGNLAIFELQRQKDRSSQTERRLLCLFPWVSRKITCYFWRTSFLQCFSLDSWNFHSQANYSTGWKQNSYLIGFGCSYSNEPRSEDINFQATYQKYVPLLLFFLSFWRLKRSEVPTSCINGRTALTSFPLTILLKIQKKESLRQLAIDNCCLHHYYSPCAYY